MAADHIDNLAQSGLGDALLAVRAGLLQAMHPRVSDELVRQAGFFEQPWPWLLRGARQPPEADDPVWGAVGADALLWGQAVRFETGLVGADLLGHPLTATEQELVYEEAIATSGLGADTLPTLHEFRVYWERTLAEVIEPTEAVLVALRPEAELPSPHGLWGLVWRAARPLLHLLPVRLAQGLLPPVARERLGLTWSAADERALQALFAGLRLIG